MKVLIAALLSLSLLAFAPSKQDLKSRAEARYPQIKQAKSAGKVGETSDGFIDAVKPEFAKDAQLKQLIDDENADRKTLYGLIASEQHVDEATVARRAAARNFDRAATGEYLKENGTWRQK